MWQRLALYFGGIGTLLALALLANCVGMAQTGRTYWQSFDDQGPAAPLPDDRGDVPAVEPADAAAFHRGMVVGLFPWRDERPNLLPAFLEMAELGVNSVSLNFNWYMRTIRDAEVFAGVADANNQTPSDEILVDAIEAAHHAGLRVMLFPSVYVLNLGDREWRGKIEPADGWGPWFDSYRAQVLHISEIAQAHEVEAICIGIELVSSEGRTDLWRRVIREARAVYDGSLLYSSNWDARARRPWFSELDYLGMNAYYELSHAAEPTLAELLDGWADARTRIERWRSRVGKPLLITEVGYQSRDGAIGRPWDYFLNSAVDLEEQRLAYEAFFRAWFEDANLGGVFFYHWFGRGGERDGGYTPRAKPAAQVLSYWFREYARRSPQARPADDGEVAPTPPERDPSSLPWPFGGSRRSGGDGGNADDTEPDDDPAGTGNASE